MSFCHLEANVFIVVTVVAAFYFSLNEASSSSPTEAVHLKRKDTLHRGINPLGTVLLQWFISEPSFPWWLAWCPASTPYGLEKPSPEAPLLIIIVQLVQIILLYLFMCYLFYCIYFMCSNSKNAFTKKMGHLYLPECPHAWLQQETVQEHNRARFCCNSLVLHVETVQVMTAHEPMFYK